MTIPDEKFFHAQVTKRVDFAPDLWMFRIRSGGEFKFVPGQYATLGVEAMAKARRATVFDRVVALGGRG